MKDEGMRGLADRGGRSVAAAAISDGPEPEAKEDTGSQGKACKKA